MKIIIFGSKGMMGSMLVYVCKRQKIDYKAISRAEFDVVRDDMSVLERLLENGQDLVVVNCIGCIPQKQYSDEEYIRINETFPHTLASLCQKLSLPFIHLSTDCVFSGKEGNKLETDTPDAETLYGQTKYKGEPAYGTVIRCSIIGPEKQSASGLLEWFLKNNKPVVNGYTHHYWNGLTTYELSRYICASASNKTLPQGLVHLHSQNTLSKHHLLQEIQKRSKKPILILPHETPMKYYVLGSVQHPPQKTIEEQLDDLFGIFEDFLAST